MAYHSHQCVQHNRTVEWLLWGILFICDPSSVICARAERVEFLIQSAAAGSGTIHRSPPARFQEGTLPFEFLYWWQRAIIMHTTSLPSRILLTVLLLGSVSPSLLVLVAFSVSSHSDWQALDFCLVPIKGYNNINHWKLKDDWFIGSDCSCWIVLMQIKVELFKPKLHLFQCTHNQRKISQVYS